MSNQGNLVIKTFKFSLQVTKATKKSVSFLKNELSSVHKSPIKFNPGKLLSVCEISRQQNAKHVS